VSSVRIDVSDIMMIAFSTAGVFVLIDGIRELTRVLVIAHRYAYSEVDLWYNADSWAALVQLTLGLWLLIGTRGIVRFVRWLRTADSQAGDHTDDPDNR